MFIDKGMTCLQSYGTADLGTIALPESGRRRAQIADEVLMRGDARSDRLIRCPKAMPGEGRSRIFNCVIP